MERLLETIILKMLLLTIKEKERKAYQYERHGPVG